MRSVDIRSEIESFLKSLWGKYSTSQTLKSGSEYYMNYSKHLFGIRSVLFVVRPPYTWDRKYNRYLINLEEPIRCFLYDKETDMVVGSVYDINVEEGWKQKLKYKVFTAEDKLNRSECPKCGFWLTQKSTMHGHLFIGCSGYPECDYTSEINKTYDDE